MGVWAFVELVLGLAGLVCLTSQALSSWQSRHFVSPSVGRAGLKRGRGGEQPSFPTLPSAPSLGPSSRV